MTRAPLAHSWQLCGGWDAGRASCMLTCQGAGPLPPSQPAAPLHACLHDCLLDVGAGHVLKAGPHPPGGIEPAAVEGGGGGRPINAWRGRGRRHQRRAARGPAGSWIEEQLLLLLLHPTHLRVSYPSPFSSCTWRVGAALEEGLSGGGCAASRGSISGGIGGGTRWAATCLGQPGLPCTAGVQSQGVERA